MPNSALKFVYRINAAVSRTRIGRSAAVHRVRRGARSLLFGTPGSEDLVLVKIHGQRMYIPVHDSSIQAYVMRPFEPHTVRLFKSAVRPGATVLDVGAHFGYYSLIAAQRAGLAGRIVAFEPDPGNFRMIKRNMELVPFQTITPILKAISNTSGVVPFQLAENSDCNSFYEHPLFPKRGTIQVECATADEFFAGGVVDVIKLDVEGHECKALDGMRGLIKNSKKIIAFVEINPECLRNAGTSGTALISKIEDLGFSARLIDEGDAELRQIDRTYLAQVSKRPDWYANLYCVKK